MFMTLCKQFHTLQGRRRNLPHSFHIEPIKHLKCESSIPNFLSIIRKFYVAEKFHFFSSGKKDNGILNNLSAYG